MNRCARLLPLTAILAFPAQLSFAFTAEQAEAGRASYTQACVACHGADLRMLPTAPLAGDEFVAKWRTRSTNDLLAQLRTTMPPESPGSLGEDGYLGVMAYILQRNGNAPSEDRLLAASGESIAAGAGRRGAGRRAGAAADGVARERHRARLRAGDRSSAARSGTRRLADAPPRLQRDELQPTR